MISYRANLFESLNKQIDNSIKIGDILFNKEKCSVLFYQAPENSYFYSFAIISPKTRRFVPEETNANNLLNDKSYKKIGNIFQIKNVDINKCAAVQFKSLINLASLLTNISEDTEITPEIIINYLRHHYKSANFISKDHFKKLNEIYGEKK
jgi:hypothetical protein